MTTWLVGDNVVRAQSMDRLGRHAGLVSNFERTELNQAVAAARLIL